MKKTKYRPLAPLPSAPPRGKLVRHYKGSVYRFLGWARHESLPYHVVNGVTHHQVVAVYAERDTGELWVRTQEDFTCLVWGPGARHAVERFKPIAGMWQVTDDGLKVVFESEAERPARVRFEKECRKFKTPGKRCLVRPDGKVELVSAGGGR